MKAGLLVKKIVLGLALMAGLAAGALLALTLKQPSMRVPAAIRVAMTEDRIARGRYLFHAVAGCAGCHSPRDLTKFSAPYSQNIGAGWRFPAELDFPGRVVGPNLTPDRDTGLGLWTDGEKIRAIRDGISKDGRALFAFMPYGHYRDMSNNDVEAIVAYMNTLPPVRNALPRTQLNFPVNLMTKFAPVPAPALVADADRSAPVEYGAYLVKMADCISCHSVLEKGAPVEGEEFSGGHEFTVNGLTVRSANITPDEATGIGRWSEERFVSKFKAFASMNHLNAPPANQRNFTLMPWPEFAQMSDSDLKAIYAYLRTVKPIHNPVDVHPLLAN